MQPRLAPQRSRSQAGTDRNIATITRRRSLEALLLLAVALAATAWYTHTQWSDPPTPGQRLLAYIPSDTLFLAGRTRPAPTSSRAGAWRSLVRPLAAKAAAIDPRRAATESGPAAGILAALGQRIFTAIERQDNWPFDVLGMPRDGVVAAYTAAGIPVLRWQLGDPRALWRTLSAAEQAASVRGRPATRGELRMRRYAFGSTGNRRLELIFATGDGFALVTLGAPGIDSEALGQALGVARPLAPLKAANLDTMAAAYGLLPNTVGFIDNQLLLDALSGTPGEHLDDLVQGFIAMSGADGRLSALAGEDCRDTAVAITDFWPRTVFGVPALAGASGGVSLRLVGEVANQERLATLDRLRGHVPEIARSRRGVLAVGLGLDAAALQPVAEGLGILLADFSVRCEVFPAIQQRLVDAAAAAFEMIGNVLARRSGLLGIKGVAAVLFGPEAGDEPSVPGTADAVLMIATEQPEAAWRIIRSATGGDDSQPALDGEAVGTLKPESTGRQTVRLALREHGVAVLLGDATLPPGTNRESQPLTPNGLFVFRYQGDDLRRVVGRAAEPSAVPQAPEAARALSKVAELLRATHLALNVSVDVVEAGINIDVRAAPAD